MEEWAFLRNSPWEFWTESETLNSSQHFIPVWYLFQERVSAFHLVVFFFFYVANMKGIEKPSGFACRAFDCYLSNELLVPGAVKELCSFEELCSFVLTQCDTKTSQWTFLLWTLLLWTVLLWDLICCYGRICPS